MPPKTRSMANESATAFARVLKEVLGVSADSHPIARVLLAMGVSTIMDFAIIRPEDFNDATYSDKETTEAPTPAAKALPTKDRNMLKALREWLRDQGTTEVAPWNALTKEQFMKFIVQGPTFAPTTDVSSTSASTTMTSAASFQRTIKRDIKDYSKFDNPKRFMQWKRQVESTARAHGVQEVLDLTYTPATPEDAELFKVKLQFMYNVFETTVLVSQARLIVRKHFEDGNAQAVWRDLTTAFAEGIAADLAAQQVNEDLITMRLDAKWTTTKEKFLTAFENKVLDLIGLRDLSLPPRIRTALLGSVMLCAMIRR